MNVLLKKALMRRFYYPLEYAHGYGFDPPCNPWDIPSGREGKSQFEKLKIRLLIIDISAVRLVIDVRGRGHLSLNFYFPSKLKSEKRQPPASARIEPPFLSQIPKV